MVARVLFLVNGMENRAIYNHERRENIVYPAIAPPSATFIFIVRYKI
jgi:hypothetical protein